MVLVQLDSHMRQNKVGSLPNTASKSQFKMDQRPKCKHKNYKTIRRKQVKSFKTMSLAMTSWM